MTATQETIITPAIREALRSVLLEMLDPDSGDSVGRAGASAYLALLDSTRDGEALGDLLDLVDYAIIDLDALDD